MSLEGRSVVVTRPLDESVELTAALRERGARVGLAPAIEIEVIETADVATSIGEALAADDAIFVSPSAIRVFFTLVARSHPGSIFRPRAFAIGPGSARLLAAHGVESVFFPPRAHDSAGVLALPELAQSAGRIIAVIGGEGGRTELAETLAARGARLLRVSCYRRRAPAASTLEPWLLPRSDAPAGHAAQADPQDDRVAGAWVDALVVTSTEGLHNLWAGCSPAAQAIWLSTPTFMPHPRIAAAGRALGLRKVHVTDSADAGIVAALERFFG